MEEAPKIHARRANRAIPPQGSVQDPATAPYTFVSFPQAILVVSEAGLPSHARYEEGLFSGEIRCRLTTETPMYVRAGLTPCEHRRAQDEGEADNGDDHFKRLKNRPEPFNHGDAGRPWIPGSTLRGMLRHLVGVASFSWPGEIATRRMSFRGFRDKADRLKRHYNHIVAGNVRAGYFERAPTGGQIVPASGLYRCSAARADTLAAAHCKRQDHACDVWFIAPGGASDRIAAQDVNTDRNALSGSPQRGTLVRTGCPPGNKSWQFVFGDRDRTRTPIHVSLEREAELAVVMENSRPLKNDPDPNSIFESTGRIRHGCPVFYVEDHGILKFFGWTMMFRLPYESRFPDDFQPTYAREDGDVDLAEAIFGWAGSRPGGPQVPARKGRVRVGSARCVTSGDAVVGSDPIHPKILGEPKVTCFQHYLTQPDAALARLKHYDDGGVAMLRGTKRYWPQRDFTLDASTVRRAQIGNEFKQYTQMRPVRKDVEFEFSVRFDNLHDFELGALLWSLKPVRTPDEWGTARAKDRWLHRVGMGKPYGFGAVTIEPTLWLEARRGRSGRYGKLFDRTSWHRPADERSEIDGSLAAHCIRRFEQVVLGALRAVRLDDVEPYKGAASLWEVDRIQELLFTLSATGISRQKTAYMPPTDHGRRRVLPSARELASTDGVTL